MIRRVIITLVISLVLIMPVFAAEDASIQHTARNNEFMPVSTAGDASIPHTIRNNEFFVESMRLSRLAVETYEYGDYGASSGFAEEAIHYAELSDIYVAEKLIAEAGHLLQWADLYNIATLHPHNYNLGKDHYENAVAAHSNEEWLEAIDFGIKSIEVLSVLQAGVSTTASSTTTTTTRANLRQYTVRTWAVERDCLWNIAGYPWIYDDPWSWRLLYEANKSKMPDPNNPDLIEPGMVLDIPSR